MKVSVAGLGAIGYGMATSLIRAGHHVTAYDVNEAAMEKLKKTGGRTVSKLQDLSNDVEVLICVVATSQQTWALFFDVIDGIIKHLPEQCVIILGITARPDFVSKFDRQLKVSGREDILVLDCPVSGGEARANSGTLSLLFSGSEQVIARSKPVLDAIGSKLYKIPGGLGSASRLKFVHQIFVGVNIVAAVETTALASIVGLDLKDVHAHVAASDGASWLYDQRVSHILDSTSVPASSLSIITKDMTMISAYCREHEVKLTTASMADHLLRFAAFRAWDLGDDTSLINLYRDKQHVDKRREANITTGDISTLLLGIHTAASIEVLAFADHLNVDQTILASVVGESAGANKAFETFVQSRADVHLKRESSLQYLKNLEGKVTAIIGRVLEQGIPVPLSATAAQCLSSVCGDNTGVNGV